MIWIDRREGSAELKPYFSPYDVETELTELEFADFLFYGNGPDGPVQVAIERKTIGFYTTQDGSGRIGNDLPSSLRTNRLEGHQVPGLFRLYSDGFIFFLIEGVWRVGSSGEVTIPGGRGREWIPLRCGSRPMLYREVSNYLLRLQAKYGAYVWRTGSPEESAAWLVGLYKWFQKDWSKHEDIGGTIYSPYETMREKTKRGSFNSRRTAGEVELVAAQLPGVDKKAFEFGKHFETVEQMVRAEEKEFLKIEGIGKKRAAEIYRWFRKKKGEG